MGRKPWNKSSMRQLPRGSQNLEHKKGSGGDEAEWQGWGQILEGPSAPESGTEMFFHRPCGAMRRFPPFMERHIRETAAFSRAEGSGGFTQGCGGGRKGTDRRDAQR